MPDSHLSFDAESKKFDRRRILKVIGGVSIVAASGAGAFLATRTPHRALAPWQDAQNVKSFNDARRFALSHAILAPNPHNRQPWLVDLKGEDTVELYCDLDRRLPHTDPFDRQITIGLGCFLELLELAANQIDFKVDTELFPLGENFPRLDDRPVARIRFSKDQTVKKDPLFGQIFERRTNKEAFDTEKAVNESDALLIASARRHKTLAEIVMEPDRVNALRELSWNAMDLELRTYRTAKESVDLMRIGKSEIEKNPDGIDLGGAFVESLDLVGILNPEAMLDPTSAMFEHSVAALKPAMESAMGYVFIKTGENSRTAQIASGRDYVRLNLKATELGIAFHPMSQALQEYAEMTPHHEAIRDQLGIKPSETLQMFARIGYGSEIKPSPRWPYETRIRKEA